jgi:two-component system OmpR family sensor kinase
MSLRLRLVAAMITVLVLAVLGGVGVVRSQRTFLIQQVDAQLTEARPFARIPTPPSDFPNPLEPGGPEGPEAPISRLFVGIVEDEALSTLLQGQLIDDIPDIPTASDELARLTTAPHTVDGASGQVRFRVMVSEVPGRDGYLVVGLPLDEVDSAVRRLQLVLVMVGGLIFTTIAAAVWWVERLGIRPIRRVTRAAEAISGGDRTHRVDAIDPRTEAGRLAHAFNLMLDDRDADEERRRQFVADASHELRTPLTSIQGYLELYDQGHFENSAQLHDVMRRMTREATRMKDLVEDLLLLANLDQQRPLRHDTVDLNRLVTDAATDALAVQPKRSILVDTPPTAVEITGDLFRLQQVIGALVDNALTHTDPGAQIRLAVRKPSTGPEVVVADSGAGLDEGRAARAFDRFFRGDDSRSRRTGNSGLGLSIARSIIEAHHGTIGLDTAPGQGCTFTIRFPPQDSDRA